MDNKKRLFLVDSVDTDPWRTSISKYVHKEDYILIIKRAGTPDIKGYVMQILSEIKNYEICKISPKDEDEYRDLVETKAKDHLDLNTEAYFVGKTMNPVFEQLKSLAEVCSGVGYHDNMRVGRVSLHKRKEDSQVDQSIFETFQEMDMLDMQAVYSSDTDEKDNSDYSRLAHGQDKNESYSNRRPDREKVKKPQRPLPQQGGIRRSESLKDIEDKIFGDVSVTKSIEEVMTPVQEAKARLVNCIQERIISHIKEKFHELMDIPLSYEQYFQFMLLLVKTKDEEDFDYSWRTLEPNVQIHVTMEKYNAAKAEVAYYFKVCNLLYGEDLWR